MGAVLNISGINTTNATPPPAQKAQPAATAVPAQPTETQLLEEPLFQLHQQAQNGDQLAIEVLAQKQAANPSQATVAANAGPAPMPGTVNLLA
ncbi:MAG: hypothetical protein ABSH53_01340 [Holophaga sp.]|jgi:hypothetical protein